MTFGEKLRELREKAGLSQADLAFRSGLHPQSVAKLEQGSRDPAFFTAKSLAKVLGVSVAVFEDTRPAEEGQPTAPEQPPAEKPKRGRPRKTAKEQPAGQPEPSQRANQSMEILQTPLEDLKERIRQELDEGPAAGAGEQGQGAPSGEKAKKSRQRKDR